MNPLAQEALGSFVRWVLMILAGYVIEAGIWTGEAAERYVAAGTLAVLALGWSLWQKYQAKRKLLTALTMPTMASEREVEQQIASIGAPSVMTAKNDIPLSPTGETT